MNQDLILLLFYLVSAVIGVIFGISFIIKAKSKKEISDGWLIIVGSLTPGIMIISTFLIILLVFYILMLPTKILSKLKEL